LIGDATKAKEKLGWQPKYTLQEMVKKWWLMTLNFFVSIKFNGSGISCFAST
jgi:GDPmannose 4,6-dehydratase